ncbi:PH domain-containing protein [Cavenderia fasciculata]|uniref:PH domain-containing protein n=1 Tax=Cavenderia fasciculata TaxID=261658 RepID=F4Q6K8_CACFS|nr:PH domain-containing protein [Cavenderia fasciculata]EGG16518.1 PH domain-containing protein [Cavenderia fasciculata]|eukprot:XP_004354918.1 PH domain-containing protein [Cavenderia fasciculata]
MSLTEMETKSSKEIIDDLQRQLSQEKSRNRTLTEELKQLKDAHLRIQLVTENEEEFITNKFMKYLNQLKKEKEELALKVEQEEEYLTNTLQKKMLAIMREKVDLENQLEQEEEFIVNKLQKQIQEVLKDKKVLEKRLENEINDHRQLLKLEGEVISLRDKIKELEGSSEHNKEDIVALKAENFVLCQKIAREQEKLTKVHNENSKLISNLEIGDERNFNTKQKRNRSVSVPNAANLNLNLQVSPPQTKIVTNSVPISRSRSSSSSNPCLITKVLKEGWIKKKVDGKFEKRYFELSSDEVIREYNDEIKQVLLDTIDLDKVIDIVEVPGTPSLSATVSGSSSTGQHTGSSVLELVISNNASSPIHVSINSSTSSTTSNSSNNSHGSSSSVPNNCTISLLIDKSEMNQWKSLITDLLPKPPQHN